MDLVAELLTPERFAPFGTVIAAPSEPGRASFADSLAHDERPPVLSTTHVSGSALPLMVDRLERHPHSSQSFLPLDVRQWLIVVASAAEPSSLRAFVAGDDVGVTIHRNVWHHGLTALDNPGRFAVLMWKDGVDDDELVDIDPVRITGAGSSRGAGPDRDFVGYGNRPPSVRWPDGSGLAINFVVNVEEGSEPSVLDGDGYSENRLTDSTVEPIDGRDLASEGLFEYGSRAGFWRVHRAFRDRGVPYTVFGCAVALERNPEIAAAISSAGGDVCSHGHRWINHRELSEADERREIAAAVESFRSTIGYQPAGWYCRYGPSINTRRLLVEHGGFRYDSDAYNDDVPYWTDIDGTDHLVVPYSLATNDAKLFTMDGRTWATYIGDAIDVLRAEAATRPALLSIGLHPRIVGQPARFTGLARVLDRVAELDDVWIASRLAIADHWAEVSPARPH